MNTLVQPYPFLSGSLSTFASYSYNSRILLGVLVGVNIIHAILGLLPKNKAASIKEDSQKKDAAIKITKSIFKDEIAPQLILGVLPIFCQVTSTAIVVLYCCMIPIAVLNILAKLFQWPVMTIFARLLFGLFLSCELFLILMGGHL